MIPLARQANAGPHGAVGDRAKAIPFARRMGGRRALGLPPQRQRRDGRAA